MTSITEVSDFKRSKPSLNRTFTAGLVLMKNVKHPQGQQLQLNIRITSFFIIFFSSLISPLRNEYETNILCIKQCIHHICKITNSLQTVQIFLLLFTESGGRRLPFSPLMNSSIPVLKLNHDASYFSEGNQCWLLLLCFR